jgi:hypothetical protein
MFPPKKKPAIGVMIGFGPKGDGPSMPPKYKARGDEEVKGPEESRSARNDAQETPQGEARAHAPGGTVPPTPESVNYHGEHETCQNCEYMEGSDCKFLQMPVDAGGHCGRFEAKSQDQGQPAMGEGGMPEGAGY